MVRNFFFTTCWICTFSITFVAAYGDKPPTPPPVDEPVADKKPTAEPSKEPAEESKKPAEDVKKPANGDDKPAADSKKPAENSTKPSEDKKPAENKTKPNNPPAPTPEEVKKPNDIEQYQPPFYVRASLNKPSGVYNERDFVSVKVVSEKDAYIYIMYTQADGKVYQIFPNSIHKDNYVEAKKEIQLGTRGDLFRWIVSKPFGKEQVSVIASVEPIKDLSKREQIARQFNPVSTKQLKGVATVLAESIWTCTHVPMETREKAPEPEQLSRRVGLFVGVSKHLFQDEKVAAAKKRDPKSTYSGPDVPGPDVSAKMISELMRDSGRLDRSRVLVNDQATRDSIQEAFTKWLPTETKPGDTVFIYYCGHTGQYKDDNGDERDQLDEMLTAYDGLSPGVFGYVRSLLLDNKLSAAKASRFRKLLANIGRAGLMRVNRRMDDVQRGDYIVQEAVRRQDDAMLDRIAQFITRESMISDDVIGRWLQGLEGRRVVVVFDSCHSGGYANVEKSFVRRRPQNTEKTFAPRRPANPEKSFARPSGFQALDLLDSEVSRLKDIGQRNLALIASSSVTRVSDVVGFKRRKLDLPPMGSFSASMICALHELPSPASVQDVFRHTKEVMNVINKLKADAAKRAAEANPEGKHEPYVPQVAHLFSDLTETVYFKPGN